MKFKHLIIILCSCFILMGCSLTTHAQYDADTPIKVGDHITETLKSSANQYIYCFTAPETGYYDFVYEDCDYTEFWHEIVLYGIAGKYYENQVDEEPDYAYYCEDKNIYKLTGYVKKGERYYIKASFMDKAVIPGEKVAFYFDKHEHEWQFRSSFKNEVYYDCEHCGVVFHTKLNVISSAKTFTYDGGTQMPWIRFDFAENTLVDDYANITEKIKLDIDNLPKNKFYKVTKPKASKNVGNYKLTVTFTGYMKNLKPVTLKYQIIPNITGFEYINCSDISANGTYNASMKWVKKKKQVSGYEIQYANNLKFKDAKSINISDYNKTTYTKKNLKANKNYYFRIRTYKKVGKFKIYSKWCNNIESCCEN